jgi:hypothetical protein
MRQENINFRKRYPKMVICLADCKSVVPKGGIAMSSIKTLRTSAADDFADIDESENTWDDDDTEYKIALLERMNEEYCAVDEDGKFRIYGQAIDPTFNPPRKYWVRYNAHDLRYLLLNQKIKKGDTSQQIFGAWMRWGGRRTMDGVVFDPENTHEGYMNLWRGWAVEEKEGDWGYLNELVHEVLCNGDSEQAKYVLDWAADMVQRPGKAAEVAICFQGEKGTGKSTFGNIMTRLAGPHGLQITSPDHLTGRFNSHLRDCICLFADEAITPYDQAANSRLKGLITESTINIEAKGDNILTVKNHIHLIMASNEDWFLPMSLADERRFFVSKVNNERQGDTKFFKKLHRQMNKGGLAALLWHLLKRDINGWQPRDAIPATDAAIEQKVRSMSPVQQWWFYVLNLDALPFYCQGDWFGESSVKISRADLRDSFFQFCEDRRINPRSFSRDNFQFFARDLSKLCGQNFQKDNIKITIDGTRQYGYRIPPRSECRREFERLMGGVYNWDS